MSKITDAALDAIQKMADNEKPYTLMKIFSACYDDYANFAYANTEALKSVGVDATGGKLIAHPFSYENELTVVNIEQMTAMIQDADIVQIMHSDVMVLKICKALNKKCVVYHTGSIYRSRQEYMKELFNPYVLMSFTDQCEFIGTGMKNEQYIATAVDTDKIKFVDKEIKLPYIIAHYPSNSEVKGTAEINRMLLSLFPYSDNRMSIYISEAKVSHEAQLKRISECDIYIEMFKPELHGKPYGCWGVTAFEAAAMGKIVITNNINLKAYTDAYEIDEPRMLIVNTEKEFVDAIKYSISLSPAEIKSHQHLSYLWCRDKHSLLSTGARLKNILEKS